MACWITWAQVAIRGHRNPAWVLTREWALSIRVTKISSWALTREWVLARENTVLYSVIFVITKLIIQSNFSIIGEWSNDECSWLRLHSCMFSLTKFLSYQDVLLMLGHSKLHFCFWSWIFPRTMRAGATSASQPPIKVNETLVFRR